MMKRVALLAVLAMFVGGAAFTEQTIGQDIKPTTQHKDSKPLKETKIQDPTKTPEQSTATTVQNEVKLSGDDRNFLMKAADGGKAEVELGQLALSKASSEEVKRFAQRMVDDHGKANTELAQLAQSKGITIALTSEVAATTTVNPDPDTAAATAAAKATGTAQDKMPPEQMNHDKMNHDKMNHDKMNHDKMAKTSGHKMMEKLAKLSGADFDREYMKHMVEDHVKDVALFEKQAKKGKDADIKAFAEKTLPTLREHLQLARDTNAKVSGTPKEKP